MGLLSKLVVEAAKAAVKTAVAAEVLSEGELSKAIVSTIDDERNKKYKNEANGRSVFKYYDGNSETNTGTFRDLSGKIIFHIQKENDGKQYRIFATNKKEIALIHGGERFAKIKCGTINETVEQKSNLKGHYYITSMTQIKIQANLLGTEYKCFFNEEEIAEIKCPVLEMGNHIIYSSEKYSEIIMMISLAINVMKAYISDNISDSDFKEYTRREKTEKPGKQAKKKEPKEKKTASLRLKNFFRYDDYDPDWISNYNCDKDDDD